MRAASDTDFLPAVVMNIVVDEQRPELEVQQTSGHRSFSTTDRSVSRGDAEKRRSEAQVGRKRQPQEATMTKRGESGPRRELLSARHGFELSRSIYLESGEPDFESGSRS